MTTGVTRRLAVLLMILIAPIALLAGCTKSDSSSSAAPSSAAVASQSASATDCPTSNTTAFAKTKFVAHSGLAFGAFRRYLYKPYKADTFVKGAGGRLTAFAKGGLAALFVKAGDPPGERGREGHERCAGRSPRRSPASATPCSRRSTRPSPATRAASTASSRR